MDITDQLMVNIIFCCYERKLPSILHLIGPDLFLISGSGLTIFLARRCWKFLGTKAPLSIDLFKCQSFLAFGGECKHRRLASENGGSLACKPCPETWENPFKTKKFD